VYVYDTKLQTNENMAYADAGFIAQNVYLLCASEGLATVVRGMVDPALHKAMSLSANKKIALAQTVGFSAK
jgi:nitroreductase